MRVARRSSCHLLPLQFCLRLSLKTLHSDGGIHQRPEGLIVRHVQFLLKDGRETTKEAVLLVVSVHMNASILEQVIELINIIHHCHTPLT